MRRMIVVMAAVSAVLPSVAQAEVVEVIREAAGVRTAPSKPHHRGTLALGARFKVSGRKDASGCKRGQWLEIGDKAWVCSRFTKTVDKAGTNDSLPIVPKGQLLPHASYVLTEDPFLYKSEDDIDKGRRSRFKGKHSFELLGTIKRGGRDYVKVSIGYLPAEQTQVAKPSDQAGFRLDLAGGDVKLPFVFAHLHAGAALLDGGAAPIRGDILARWSRQQLLGEQKIGKQRFYRVRAGDDAPERLVAASDVRVVRKTALPKGVGPGDRWVDVDVPNQVMVAYVGDSPILATLVSTARTTTPAGTFRIYKKRANVPLRSRPSARSKYWMETPWVMTIRGAIAMHTSYWHDDFGVPKSHGCVNLTPQDARWLWDWSEPQLPPGWASIDQTPGTVVRIRK